MIIDFHQRFAVTLAFRVELALTDEAFFKIEFIGDGQRIARILCDQSSRFKNKESIAVIVYRDQLIGRLTLILEIRFIHPASSTTDDAAGQGPAKRPAGNVHFMHPWLPTSPFPKSQNQCQL